MNVLDHNDSQAYIIYSSILVSFLKRSALHYFFTYKSFQTFGPALQIEIQKILQVACFIPHSFGPALFSCNLYEVMCVVCVSVVCCIWGMCLCGCIGGIESFYNCL